MLFDIEVHLIAHCALYQRYMISKSQNINIKVLIMVILYQISNTLDIEVIYKISNLFYNLWFRSWCVCIEGQNLNVNIIVENFNIKLFDIEVASLILKVELLYYTSLFFPG